jgi:hypothetical protein
VEPGVDIEPGFGVGVAVAPPGDAVEEPPPLEPGERGRPPTLVPPPQSVNANASAQTMATFARKGAVR